MQRKTYLSIFLALIVCLSLTNFRVARADDGTPTDPPPAQTTDAATEPPAANTDAASNPPVVATDPPVDSTPVPLDSSPTPGSSDITTTNQAPAEPTDAVPTDQVPATEAPSGNQANPSYLPTQVSGSSDVVVLDANGEQVPMASQQAADIIASTDPMWCPAGVLPGGGGCTTNFASVALLQNDINNNASNYAHAGIIYFTSSAGNSFTLNTSSIGTGDFTTIKSFNLTLQGGWNGLNGANTFAGQTNFGTNSIAIGSSTTPWVGNITLSNFIFDNASSTPVSVFTTSGSILLDNVDVSNQANGANSAVLQSTSGNITVQNGSSFDGNNTGNNRSNGLTASTGGTGAITISDTAFSDSKRNGSHANGATLSAPTITLTNVTSNNNDKSGIDASNYNLLTLNNVTANGNGTGDATLPGNFGSGITAVGKAGSRILVLGGSFNNNKRYGLEDTNSTVYVQSNPTCTGNVGGCYNVATIFDNTPPTISPNITGILGANGWYTSNVTVSWTVQDPQSGILSSTGCTSANLTSETVGALITCSATNNAGLSNSALLTIKIDKTAPTITFVNRTASNGNGWNNSDVSVNWSCTDTLSGAVGASAIQTLTSEGLGQSATGTCTDNAGNTSTNTQAGVNIDKTAPTIAFISRTPANGNGWNNGDVTINWNCTDGLSGALAASISQTLNSEGLGQSASGICLDKAGNFTANSQTGINIDKSSPVLALPTDMVVEATVSTGATVNYSASVTDNLDAGISVACIPASGALFLFGNTAINCSATDLASNSAAGGFHVTVQDTTPPVISAHGDVLDTTLHTNGANVIYTNPVTLDVVDGAGIANCSPASGSHFQVGDTLITCHATDSHGNAATPLTFTVHLDFERKTGISTAGGNGVIPVTGGSTINIVCPNSVNFGLAEAGINITFGNLCDYKSVIESQAAAGLPAKLPEGASFIEGLTVDILSNGSLVNPLPSGASINLSFSIPANQQTSNLVALFWNGSEWVEVTGQMSSDGFFKITSTQSGTFLLISK